MLTNKVSSLTSALTVQMKFNIENYLSTMFLTSTLIFSRSDLYTYSAVDTTLSEYDALNTESEISDFLYDLSIMENYSDFGIVYQNNHCIGKMSNGTKELYGDNIYEILSGYIVNERTLDGWATGYNDNYNRIYYIKRINDTSIFVTSFYTVELSSVFEHPADLGDITLRLTDENYMTMYSTKAEEIGQPLLDEIRTRVDGLTNSTLVDNDYVITVNTCNQDWYVICSIPSADILQEKSQLLIYTVIVILLCTIAAFVLTSIFSRGVINPVSTMVGKLSKKAQTDQLTGLLNKKSFEEFVVGALDADDGDSRFALILMDVDNFKGINDSLGHAIGDEVLSGVGKLLRDSFREGDIAGRIGGDEFCVLMRLPANMDDFYPEIISSKCTSLGKAFHDVYRDTDGNSRVSASIGISIYDQHGSTFQELYEAADKALYMSKEKGKDTFTLY
jgi:diguanylate cyclase (GGDEF)-like protein